MEQLDGIPGLMDMSFGGKLWDLVMDKEANVAVMRSESGMTDDLNE